MTPTTFVADHGRVLLRGSVTGVDVTSLGLYVRAADGWTLLAQLALGADRTLMHELAMPAAGTYVYALATGTPFADGVLTSNAVTVTVAEVGLALDAASAAQDTLRSPTLSGTLTPALPHLPVSLWVRSGESWKLLTTTKTTSDGRFADVVDYGRTEVATFEFRTTYTTPTGRIVTSATFTLSRLAVFDAQMRTAKASDVPRSYRKGCPVKPSQLTVVTMNFWGFDGRIHRGTLIVRSSWAKRMTAGFQSGFDARFPLRRMADPSKYANNDYRSMRADNTYAFSCRRVTGNPYRLSPHAYGSSVDINPYENPYRAPNRRWYPSKKYVDRSPTRKGMLTKHSAITRRLRANGFRWFHGWDWQHFQP